MTASQPTPLRKQGQLEAQAIEATVGAGAAALDVAGSICAMAHVRVAGTGKTAAEAHFCDVAPAPKSSGVVADAARGLVTPRERRPAGQPHCEKILISALALTRLAYEAPSGTQSVSCSSAGVEALLAAEKVR